MGNLKYFIAIPTYNGGALWHNCAEKLSKYLPKDTLVQVIDSGSKDDTVNIAQEYGFKIHTISSSEFNHGATRNLAVKLQNEIYDVVIFLTQDAIPEENFVEELLSVFYDVNVACAYGKQLPHSNANPIATHARLFNYSDNAYIVDARNMQYKGLKSVFMSNSFAAYRISIFNSLGGFPSNTILCEDMYYAAKALSNNYKVAYEPKAIVKHSHNYTPIDEFKRYFDIGVFHSSENWIRVRFGTASGEGTKFIISEIKYLYNKNPLYLPKAFLNNLFKILGYKIGMFHKILPVALKRMLSMHSRFWTA